MRQSAGDRILKGLQDKDAAADLARAFLKAKQKGNRRAVRALKRRGVDHLVIR